MTTYERISCPHCGKTVDQKVYSGMKTRFVGNPIQECQHCKQKYYDDRITEYAYKPIEWYVKRQPQKMYEKILKIVLYSSLPVVALLMLIQEVFWLSSVLLAMCQIVLGLFLLSYILLCLYNLTHTRLYVDEKFLKEYEESKKRLENIEYLIFLYRKGAKMPKELKKIAENCMHMHIE